MATQPPPAVNRVGHLDLPASRQKFSQARDGLAAAQWTDGVPAANLKLVATPAMRALRDAGVLLPALNLDATGAMGAVFYPVGWMINANRRNYEQATPSVDWMRARAVDFYHEARHAEQFFIVAGILSAKTTALTANEQAIKRVIPQSAWAAAHRTARPPTVYEQGEITRWIDGYQAASGVQQDMSVAREQNVLTGRSIAAELARIPNHFSSEEECLDYEDQVVRWRTLTGLVEDLYRGAFARYVGMAMEQDAYAVAGRLGAALPTASAVAAALRREAIDPSLGSFADSVTAKAAAFRTPPPSPVPVPVPPVVAPDPEPEPDDKELVLDVHDEAELPDDDELVYLAGEEPLEATVVD
jgi:hypothetical protein